MRERTAARDVRAGRPGRFPVRAPCLDGRMTPGQSAAMNARNFLYVLAVMFATAAISADNGGSGSIGGSDNGAQVGKEKEQAKGANAPMPLHEPVRCQRAALLARGAPCPHAIASALPRTAGAMSSPAVRTRTAAQRGDNGIDYGAFCNYFAHPDASCGAGYYRSSCQRRLAYRHGICLDAMEQHRLAALRLLPHRARREQPVPRRTARLQGCLPVMAQTRSITIAMPCPTPMHIVHSA